jgi:protein CWC15
VADLPEPATSSSKRQLENGDAADEEDPEAKRRRILEESRDIDADSENDDEGDSSEDDRYGFIFWVIWERR